jgi:hypothetical protein
MSTCLDANGVDAIIACFALQASARFWDWPIPGAHSHQRCAAEPIQLNQSFSRPASWHDIWLSETVQFPGAFTSCRGVLKQ